MTQHTPDPVTATRGEGGEDFAPHPEGQYLVRCVDCINLGEQVSTYPGRPDKLVPKVALVFRSENQNEHGHHYDITMRYTVSTHPKSNLAQFLSSWRGRPFTEVEAEAFQVHTVVGVGAIAVVAHGTSKAGRQFANITSITRLMKGMEVPDTGEYVRGDYWRTVKEENAKAVGEFHRRSAVAKAAVNDDEPPLDESQALDDDDSDLPF
jgi:hypothetical protein